MSTNSVLESAVVSPLGKIGRGALDMIAYLGGMGALTIAAARSIARPGANDPPFLRASLRELSSLLAMGTPLVGLVHVGLGSFLSMQAYFGGTFVDGTGAVVGVGLIRNLASLMTGMILAGLIAARTTPELRKSASRGFGDAPRAHADRWAAAVAAPDPGRLAAVRLTAALLAGPILSLWGVLVGTVVGWQVAQTVLGVSTHDFFTMFIDMLWTRDVAGLLLKGMINAFAASLFACHEGFRGPSASTAPDLVPSAVCRAVCLASVAMLVVNSGWFLIFYHSGSAFGPTLLAPPAL